MQRAKDIVVRGPLPARAMQRLRALSALFSLAAIACGGERPPWTGFDLFPADASTFELSPELTSSLAAAEAAFVTQLAAERRAQSAGAASVPDESSISADAGARRTSRMAAGTAGRPKNSAPPKTSDAGVVMTAAAGGGGDRPIQRTQPDAAVGTGAGGHAGAIAPNDQPSSLDAGATLTGGAGGHAGASAPNDQPTPTSPLDAGMPPAPDADGGG